MHVVLDSVLPRRSVTMLLTFGAAALLIIIGLLALHTFGAESPAHTAVVAPVNIHDSGEPASSTIGNQSPGACDESCQAVATTWSPDQSSVIACVLALLSGLLVLLIPRLPLYRIATSRMAAADPASPRRGLRQQALSLIALSISRT